MTEARNAGLHEAALTSATQVRLVKARLLLATRADAVKQVLDYSGVQGSEFAALLLAAVDGDVDKCKAEIDRFWKDQHYMGPLIDDEPSGEVTPLVRWAGQRAQLKDTM